MTGGRAAKGKGKRKRGDDGESVKTGKDGKGTTELAADEAAEEEEEEEGDEGVEGEEKLDKEQERRNLAYVSPHSSKRPNNSPPYYARKLHTNTLPSILVEAFNPDQADRYDLFRRVKLKKETVRKIVNQTLSQSVPPSVITSINAYTKIFIGNLIERARDVQEQYAAAALPLPPDEDAPSSRPNGPSASINASYQHDPTSPTDIDTNPFAQLKEYASPESPLEPPQPDESTKNRKKKKKNQENLGPLLPDHLREALRRYKKAGEGGGVGMGAQSLVGMGVPGVGSARVGGRRLFK